jgi:hypothetical protein
VSVTVPCPAIATVADPFGGDEDNGGVGGSRVMRLVSDASVNVTAASLNATPLSVPEAVNVSV